MGDDTKISGPGREKSYCLDEGKIAEDKALAADDKAKAEWEAKKRSENDICATHPEYLICAPKDRTPGGASYEEIAKNLAAPKPGAQRDKLDAIEDREAWKAEADTLGERLRKNPVPYAGKREDIARLAELQKKLATTPEPTAYAVPATNDAGRKADAGDGPLRIAGTDGLSLYAGGTVYKSTDGKTKVELDDASAQIGLSTELQVTSVRITDSDPSGSVVIEGPALRATGGYGRNDDGSVGVHAGASGGIATVQVTKTFGDGASGMLGITEGVGVGGSLGVKTTQTGETAACVQLSALFFSAGVCVPIRM